MTATFDPKERKEAINALAASWASIDGKLDTFAAEAQPGDIEAFLNGSGTHMGYMVEAEEMLTRLERRGFTITRLVNPIRAVK